MKYDLLSIDSAAKYVLEHTKGYDVMDFSGEMGAGKTTLISELCALLKVQDEISSPTFSIVNEYETEQGERLYHFDFYRIEDESELPAIGITEYLDSGNRCLLEWSEKMGSFLPDRLARIKISKLGPFERSLEIEYHG